MSLFEGTLILLLLSLAPLAVACALAFRQFRRKTSETESRLVRPMLRSPGARLRREISSRRFDLSLYLGLLCSIGPYAGLWILIQAYYAERILGALDFSIFVLCTLGLGALVLYKFFSTSNAIYELQRSLECELAVGQELDQLQRQGYHVFHGVPCEGFSIDHVVVGRNGVYAVETKARSKPDGASSRDYRITVDNKGVNIPIRRGIVKDLTSVEQAQNQSEWLSKSLSVSLGEKISVAPMLVFPGWTITNYNDDAITVFNERQLRTELPQLKAQRLADANVSLVAHQLDLRVREIDEGTHLQLQEQKAA